MSLDHAESRARERRALWALLRIKLWTTLRPAHDSASGKVRMHPLRALVFSYGLMGLLFAGNARAFADLRSYAIMFFTSVLTIGMFSVVPDAVEQQRREFEILHSKPISARTMMIARAVHVFVIMTLVVVCVATAPLFYAQDHFGTPPLRVALLFSALLLAVFAAALAWNVVQLAILAHVSVDRVRSATQVVLTLAVVTFSSSSMILRLVRGVHGAQFALEAEAWRLYPPTWFVDAALGGLDVASHLERGAVALFFGLALVAFARMTRPALHAKLMEQLLEPPNVHGKRPVGMRILEFLRRSTVLRRHLLPQETSGVAALILTYASREQLILARLLPLRVLVLAVFASDVFLLKSDTPLTAVLGAMLLVEGVRLIAQSPQRGADWVLRAAPISPERVLDGIRVAAWIGFFSWPLVLTTLSVAAHRPPEAAALAFVAYALEGHIMISLATGIDPAWPLSREQRLPVFFGYILGWTAIAVLQVLRHAFVVEDRGAGRGLYLAALVVVAALALRWSRRRFSASAES